MTSEANLDSPLEKKRLRFLERKENKFSQSDKLGLFLVGTGALHIVSILLIFASLNSVNTVARKPVPSLVQLGTGTTIPVAPLGNKDRTPQVVAKFVSDTMIKMLNWSGTKPPTTVEEATKPQLDLGVEVHGRGAGGGRIATAAWEAGFSLSEDFRKEFLKTLADITPSGIFSGSTQVALVPLEIQPPQKVGEGRWKVRMVANLLVFDKGNSVGDVISFNKEIFVQSVEAPEYPGENNGISSIIYQQRKSGLEIYGIRDLVQENL